MPNPNDPKKMTPFQEAMLKFEQALQESLAVEQARQAELAARQTAQGRPAQRPYRPGGYPAARPGVAPPGRPMPVQQTRSDTAGGSSSESDMGPSLSNGEVFLNVGEHAVVPTVTESVSETVVEIAPQVAAFDEVPAPGRTVPGKGTPKKPTAPALSSAPQPIIPLAPAASPLMQGIIWAEVLGKPVSKRRGHGRHGF